MFFNEILCPEDTYIGFVILLLVIIAEPIPNAVRLRNKVYMLDNMKTAVRLRTKVYIPAILLYHINFVLIYHLNFIYNICISSVYIFSLYIIIMRKKHMMIYKLKI